MEMDIDQTLEAADEIFPIVARELKN